MSSRKYIIVTAVAFLLTACTSSWVPPPTDIAAKQAAVAFSIAIPRTSTSQKLRPAYVSTATQSATITVTPSGGSASTPTTVNCSTTALSCSGTVDAPVGTDTFAVELFDAQNGAGNILSRGAATQTIVSGISNAVNLTFNPIVASLAISVGPGGPTKGVPGTYPVVVTAKDADNNTIVGPGTFINGAGTPTAITISDSDTSGATSLSATTFSTPGSSITLTYNGTNACPTLTASTPGVSPTSVLLTLNAFGC